MCSTLRKLYVYVYQYCQDSHLFMGSSACSKVLGLTVSIHASASGYSLKKLSLRLFQIALRHQVIPIYCYFLNNT